MVRLFVERVDIHFKSKKLQRILTNEREITKHYGADRARLIMRRYFFLEAADNLTQVPNTPPMRMHQLSGRLEGKFAVDVDERWRILFEPASGPVPKREDGGIDLCQISAIRILDITDYH